MLDTKLLTSKERAIHDEARALLSKDVSAPEFSARFFGPDGLLRGLWATSEERKAVTRSELYKWLQQRLAELRRREGEAFEREMESLSGRLTVVVPKSLHAGLKREAQREGVSLSELIRLKLGMAYQDMVHASMVRGTAAKQGRGK